MRSIVSSVTKRISLDMVTDIDGVTHHGIDGIYHNPNGHPPYIIAEAKYGSARLSYLKNPKVKQMSHEWIMGGVQIRQSVISIVY